MMKSIQSRQVKKNFILLIIYACLQILIFIVGKSNADNSQLITGRFINVTFLEKISYTVAGSVPFYCVEMIFNGSDSVEIFNGFEEYKLSYVKSGEDFVLQKAVQGNDIPFMLINDSTIILIDTMWTSSPGMSVFYKVNDEAIKSSRKWMIDYLVNESMITGDYFINDQSESGKSLVSFKTDGSVKGLLDYTEYFICYSGDCTGETDPPSNLITFTNSSDQKTDYAFEINKENNTLIFYKIAPPVKDIKGERAILDVVFELRRK